MQAATMLEDDYQDRREQLELDLQISALNDTIACLKHDKFKAEVEHHQQICELRDQNRVLELSLRDAGDNIALLKERLPPNACVAENQPPVPDFEAVTLPVKADHLPLPTEVTMGANAVGQGKIDNMSVASHVPDEVVVVHGLPALENKFVPLINIDDDSYDSSRNGALGDVARLAFRETVDMLRTRLILQPEFALHYKAPGPLLRDLAIGSRHSGKYFVAFEAEKNARESAVSYLDFSVRLFEEFFDMEVALHCIMGGYLGLPDAGLLLARLPEEAVTVFVQHCVIVAQHYFGSNTCRFAMLRAMARWINDHLQGQRDLYGMGPPEALYGQYRLAMQNLM